MNRRQFIKIGASAPVLVALSADIFTGCVPNRAAVEGQIVLVGRMERSKLAFYRENAREFEAQIDAALAELKKAFMDKFHSQNRQARTKL